MSTFADRCGLHDAAREASLQRASGLVQAQGLELVRFAWCDVHGVQRGKTLVAGAMERALRDGIGMVSTLMLKDTSDRTAFKVFEPGGTASLPGFGFANNLLLLADPSSFKQLPWAAHTGSEPRSTGMSHGVPKTWTVGWTSASQDTRVAVGIVSRCAPITSTVSWSTCVAAVAIR